MALAIRPLYEDIAQMYGSGVGSDKLAAATVRAVNYTVDELSIVEDRASKHAHVTTVEGSVSTISDNYSHIVLTGVRFWLTRNGFIPIDPRVAAAVLKDTKDEWEDAKGLYVMDLVNIEQSTETNDITQQGYVTK